MTFRGRNSHPNRPRKRGGRGVPEGVAGATFLLWLSQRLLPLLPPAREVQPGHRLLPTGHEARTRAAPGPPESRRGAERGRPAQRCRTGASPRSISIPPRIVLNNLAAEYQYLGLDADAVATLRQARTVSPDNEILVLNRGLELTRPVTCQNSCDAVSRAYLAYFLVRLNPSQAGRAELERALGLEERNTTVLRRAYYARRLPIWSTISNGTPIWWHCGRIRWFGRWITRLCQCNKK
jgi:hypothetical protein